MLSGGFTSNSAEGLFERRLGKSSLSNAFAEMLIERLQARPMIRDMLGVRDRGMANHPEIDFRHQPEAHGRGKECIR